MEVTPVVSGLTYVIFSAFFDWQSFLRGGRIAMRPYGLLRTDNWIQ
jgi:hypothetical protein